jgi:excisionase family DNA binding protein
MSACLQVEDVELVRITEAAYRLGVPTSAIYKLIKTGFLTGYKLPGSCLRVARQEINSIIAGAAETAAVKYVKIFSR